jgi:outer membrane immunogenic protein
MTKLLLASVAVTLIGVGCAEAADTAYPTKAPTAAPAFSWTGCHIGTHLGQGSGHTTFRDTVPDGAIDQNGTLNTAHTEMSGGFYGGQLGCDTQFSGNWVAGLQGSAAVSNITGSDFDAFNVQWNLRARTDWFGDVSGRIGWAIDRALVYGRGGVAFAHNRFEIENNAINIGTPMATRVGWTLGSGIEWAFASNWSVFLEGGFYNFDRKTVHFNGDAPSGQAPFNVFSKEMMETVKFGVNYRM